MTFTLFPKLLVVAAISWYNEFEKSCKICVRFLFIFCLFLFQFTWVKVEGWAWKLGRLSNAILLWLWLTGTLEGTWLGFYWTVPCLVEGQRRKKVREAMTNTIAPIATRRPRSWWKLHQLLQSWLTVYEGGTKPRQFHKEIKKSSNTCAPNTREHIEMLESVPIVMMT